MVLSTSLKDFKLRKHIPRWIKQLKLEIWGVFDSIKTGESERERKEFCAWV